MAELQSGEGRVMIDSVVWASYNNVTDKQTAINVTDRQPRCHNKCRANTLRRAAKTAHRSTEGTCRSLYVLFTHWWTEANIYKCVENKGSNTTWRAFIQTSSASHPWAIVVTSWLISFTGCHSAIVTIPSSETDGYFSEACSATICGSSCTIPSHERCTWLQYWLIDCIYR